MKKLVLSLLLIVIVTVAQDAAAIDVNNIYLPFNNKGILADVNFGTSGASGRYPGPAGKSFLFSGGFLLSGYSDTTLWANGIISSNLIEDYQAGNVGSNPSDTNNVIYSVKETDTPFGEEWQNWKDAVEQGAYYYDGDLNGIYDPIDYNNNGSWDLNEDRPDLLYDATYFTVYNDGIPPEDRRFQKVNPLGIEIRQTLFASARNTGLKNVVFVRYSFLYKGLEGNSEPDSLSDVIFSIYTDSDIGATTSAASDDKVGCDTSLQAGYTFNDGEDDDWGINPPAVFKTIVQGPLVRSQNINSIGYNKRGPYLGNETYLGYTNLKMTSFTSPQKSVAYPHEPRTREETRNYGFGLDPLGDSLDPCEFPFGYVGGDVECSEINPIYWFSGDPVTDYGWLYGDAQDIRDMINTGTFTLHKNEPMDIIVAYVVGQGTDALNSITVAREITQYVHEEYERNFSTIVGVKDEKEEVVNTFSLSQNYPNPFNPTTTIEYTITGTPLVSSPSVKGRTKEGFVSLVVYNILGQKVKTLVNEAKAPGNYKVTFDASQLSSGVYFYRLESGSFVQTNKMLLIK